MEETKRVLAIGAHPDDMEQFCGGTLLLLKKAGYDITIAPMTSGECGSHEHSAAEIVQIRQKEAREGARRIGADYRCLGIRDGSIPYDVETVSKVVSLIREVRPQIIFTHPTVDYMADHAHTGKLVLWSVPESKHQNFPAPTQASALDYQPWLYHTDPQGLIDMDGQIVRINTIVDITSVIEEKLHAFSAHESQLGFLKASQTGINAIEKTRRWAATRGQQARVEYAEGFCQQLLEEYPRHNILQDILKEKVFTL